MRFPPLPSQYATQKALQGIRQLSFKTLPAQKRQFYVILPCHPVPRHEWGRLATGFDVLLFFRFLRSGRGRRECTNLSNRAQEARDALRLFLVQ
ncbi:hypothetical protein Vi05172_g4740 [Venturia inaequalis]|nr:hypothetical protein Vi05172_g4740 [Venturia inaequalis]